MKCAVHPEREAIGTCVECGLAFCEECRVGVGNKNYCKKCVEIVVKKEKNTQRNPVIAALLSFFIGGAGQLYNGQIGKGVLIFLTTWLVIPWIYGIIDAYNTANKINRGETVTEKTSGCLIAVAIILIVTWFIMIIGILAAIAIPNLVRAKLV
ncbi:MAG: NINE protein, partial [Candidatus Omnitrophica bacterium]|nr:NINE protein [Candidatus Omnitrophota bacterium]